MEQVRSARRFSGRSGAKTAALLVLSLFAASAAPPRLAAAAEATLKLSPGVPIYTSAQAGTPVYIAVLALQRDLEKVLGRRSPIRALDELREPGICIVDSASDRRSTPLSGWEAHRVFLDNSTGAPQVMLQGSDARGTIYAIYTFSEQVLGVPPLWFYSSWKASPRDAIDVPSNLDISVGPPQVKYRAWFPNDKDLFTEWRKRAPENDVMWLEAALRSKINTIEWNDLETDYSKPYSVSPTTRLIHEYGLVNTTHHHSPLNASLQQWEQFWTRFEHSPPPELSLANQDKLEAFWRYHVDSVVKNDLEMLWVIGFRGRDDRPFWTAFADAPDSMKDRGAIISRMVDRQMQIVKDVTGDARPAFRTIFYDELSDLMSQGLIQPPGDPDLIWTYVAARRNHYPNEDVQRLKEGSDRHLGYYFNYQFTSTGSHLAPAEGPWKMEQNFRYLAAKSRHPLAIGVVNAGNIREHVLELAAFSAMMWNFDSYHSDAYLKRYCATYFGDEHADEVARLYKAYYDASWQPKRPDLPFVDRQYLFQDLRYRRAIDSLCDAFAKPFDPNPLKDLANEQLPGRTYRIVPADSEAADQVTAIINGTAASATRFLAVARDADRLAARMGEGQRAFFNDNLRAPAYFMHHLNLSLHNLAQAYRSPAADDRRAALLEAAKTELRSAQVALKSSAHSAFATWYDGDTVFGMQRLQAKIDALQP